jgi:hypothetical protein
MHPTNVEIHKLDVVIVFQECGTKY